MKNASKFFLAAIPLLGLAACGDSDVAQAIGTSEPQVRLAHVAPGAPNVTLERNNGARSEATNVAYPTITNYFNVDTGGADFRVRLTSNGNVVGNSMNFDAKRGHRYTIFAVADSATSTSVVQVDDPTNRNIVSDDSRVRVFNASYNVPSLDVYTVGRNENLNSPDVKVGFANVGFKQSDPKSDNESLKRRGGDYKIIVTKAGTKDILFQGNYTIRDNQTVQFVTVPNDVQNPTGINLLVKQGDDATVSIPRL